MNRQELKLDLTKQIVEKLDNLMSKHAFSSWELAHFRIWNSPLGDNFDLTVSGSKLLRSVIPNPGVYELTESLEPTLASVKLLYNINSPFFFEYFNNTITLFGDEDKMLLALCGFNLPKFLRSIAR